MAERKRRPNTTRMVTTNTVVRMQSPKSSRKPKPKKTKVAKAVAQEINPTAGFVGFLRDYAIVGLSIGFIIGNQMSTLVKTLVASFINPLTHLLFGTALSQRTFTLRFHNRVALFGWGSFVYGLIELILLLVFIYLTIRFFNLEKLNKPKEQK